MAFKQVNSGTPFDVYLDDECCVHFRIDNQFFTLKHPTPDHDDNDESLQQRAQWYADRLTTALSKLAGILTDNTVSVSDKQPTPQNSHSR